ncbi:MAG: CPBP family intramembrane metalloprotease [Deltaproteobacteria bacterium]|nr:CPBP family intramembrane metalloprotease [Deltaproteobacteria bacterium]
MRREIFLIYVCVIGTASLLYRFRELSWLGANLRWIAALLLFYVPLLHNRLRTLSLPFFESDRQGFFHSLKIFLFAALLIFPLFLVGNHFYQTVIWSRSFNPSLPDRFGSLLLLQVALIALPEEVFFRGWLQGLIRKNRGPLASILITSLIFAFSHSVIAMQWWHFAIFFPGSVFGWLREKTGAVTASVVFHTVSNLLVVWIQGSYR